MALRILVVEDEMLIALHIEDMVTELGFQVVGPAMRLAPALAMARSESLDCAVLDVNLANEKSFPVADALRERGIPFIFATGYGSKGLDDAYRGAATIQKPFRPQDLERAIHRALGAG
jgi:CheY-like chemotaxis protein